MQKSETTENLKMHLYLGKLKLGPSMTLMSTLQHTNSRLTRNKPNNRTINNAIQQSLCLTYHCTGINKIQILTRPDTSTNNIQV